MADNRIARVNKENWTVEKNPSFTGFDIGKNLPLPEKGKGRPLTDLRKSLRAKAKATIRARRKKHGLPVR